MGSNDLVVSEYNLLGPSYQRYNWPNGRVVSTRRWVPTNWVAGWTLQPSTEPVVASFSVPLDFLVKSQVSGRGVVNVRHLLTKNVVSNASFLFSRGRRSHPYWMDSREKEDTFFIFL